MVKKETDDLREMDGETVARMEEDTREAEGLQRRGEVRKWRKVKRSGSYSLWS